MTGLHQISNHALLVSLMHVKLGREFSVAERLRRRLGSSKDKALYYSCYGTFDLIEMLMIDSSPMIHNVPMDSDITYCDYSLFYSWESISKPVHEWVGEAKTIILALLSIQPKIEEYFTFEVEKLIIEHIKKTLNDDANIFIGMGYADILLMLKANSFDQILPNISKLRRELTVGDLFKGTSLPCNPKIPVFICSTTFAAIAHPRLAGKTEYDDLEGKIFPVVNIDCSPGYEKFVAQAKPSSCHAAKDIYGKYDVSLIWQEQVDLSTFAKELTDFRNNISKFDAIRSTSTTLIGFNDLTPHEGESISPPPDVEDFSPMVIPGLEYLIEQGKKLNPEESAKLFDFLGRFNTYLGRRESYLYFRDMGGIHRSIKWVLDQLSIGEKQKTYRLHTYLSQIIDLANHGIYQRYAHLESHYELRTRIPFPFLCDINAYIGAASYVPCFIFKQFFPEDAISDIWSGFILFGQSYSYEYLPGNILSYQASALHRPIEDWWGITHEVGHAIYWLTDFKEKYLPKDIRDYIDDLDREIVFWTDIEEIFANWFDYRYVFAGDKSLYFSSIWRSWLRWDRVWKFKVQYIFRSLAVFISDELDIFYQIQNTLGYQETIKYLNIKLQEMLQVIQGSVPDFTHFLLSISDDDYIMICKAIIRIEHLLNYLQNEYFDIDFYNRLNPDYPGEILLSHVNALNNGSIITDNIPNPCKLLHKLIVNYWNKPVPINVSAALILSLWFAYIKNYPLWDNKPC